MRWLAVFVLIFSSAVTFAKQGIQMTPEHVPGEILVKIRDLGPRHGFRAQMIQNLQSSMGAKALVDIKPLPTDKKFHLLRLANDSDMNSALERLRSDPGVEYAEPNYLYHSTDAGLPDDPYLSETWGIHNLGQLDPQGKLGTEGCDIGVLPLWRLGFRGSSKVVVAVVDTGIEWDHPDLVANLYTNPGEAGDRADNGVDDDGNGFVDDVHGWNFIKNNNNSRDDNFHGTHVAGTIGAEGNNGIGVAGVNWNVSLMPLKFLNSSGNGHLSDAVEAIQYAIKMGARVISNSWSGGDYSKALFDVIHEARDAGILFVAAAGNDSSNVDEKPRYPASYPLENVISVAATDNNDQLASFSNQGFRSVDIAAPGVDVYSTVPGKSYKTLSGTSMAVPHVSGVAALLMSINPAWGALEIKRRIVASADRTRELRHAVRSRGRINAYNAYLGIASKGEEPDESLWKTIPFNLETLHPVTSGRHRGKFKIKYPGAKFIRVHFQAVGLDPTKDRLWLEAHGHVIDAVRTDVADFTSDYGEGNKLTIRFKTDYKHEIYGFRIDRIQVIAK